MRQIAARGWFSQVASSIAPAPRDTQTCTTTPLFRLYLRPSLQTIRSESGGERRACLPHNRWRRPVLPGRQYPNTYVVHARTLMSHGTMNVPDLKEITI
jgi:hypothetical protein